ncbi:hypothetical protein RF11_06129 [Thelohanellus kitauei]|uniref:Uncharacterized protein n=1 Tax=Thelohanellus kitauei TaxID=669202 RepID=A0A0C2J6X6_THEKT|nr:hypothetical protein RF11_06129 [Thelohanellus kitauei]
MEKLPNGGNHRAKLTDEQKESLCDILEKDCSSTIQRICDRFFERHNIRIEGIIHELSENSSASINFFFIDETGFQVNMICLYGGELTGVRVTRVVPALGLEIILLPARCLVRPWLFQNTVKGHITLNYLFFCQRPDVFKPAPVHFCTDFTSTANATVSTYLQASTPARHPSERI